MRQASRLQKILYRTPRTISATTLISGLFRACALSFCVCYPTIARSQVTDTARFYACNGFLIHFYDFHFPAETPDSFISYGQQIVADEPKVEAQVCSGIASLQPMSSEENADITGRINALNAEKDTTVFNAAMNDDLNGYLSAMQQWENDFYDLYRETVRIQNKRGVGPARQFVNELAQSFLFMTGVAGASPELPAKEADELSGQIGKAAEDKLLEHEQPSSPASAMSYFLKQVQQAPQ